jgi:hypothetical protein
MKHRKTKQGVTAMVGIMAARFGGVFHVSELKKAVLRVLPETNLNTFGRAVHRMSERGEIIPQGHGNYQLHWSAIK